MSLLPSGFDRQDRLVELEPEYPKDVLLNYDILGDVYWYRFRRQRQQPPNGIVYVKLEEPDILSEADRGRPYSPSIIRALRKAAGTYWGHGWSTLTIFRDERGNPTSLKNEWQPPYIPAELLLPHITRVNTVTILGDEQDRHASQSIREIYWQDHRLFRGNPSTASFPWGYGLDHRRSMYTEEPPPLYARASDNLLIVKSEPFFTGAPSIAQEAKIYQALTLRNCFFMPKLVGYLYDENPSQVNGLILEKLEGSPAGPRHYRECENALLRLHGFGVLHNSLSANDIIMTDQGPKFMDFSDAVLDFDVLPEDEKPFGPQVKWLWKHLLQEGETELTQNDMEIMKCNELESLEEILMGE